MEGGGRVTALAIAADRVGEKRKERRQHRHAKPGPNLANEGKTDTGDGRPDHCHAVAADGPGIARQRIDHRADAEDQQNVRDIGTDDVACRQIGPPFQRRLNADHELRQRGAEADDDQADHRRRDIEALGQSHGAT
jgi:hypothetical protein